MSQIWIISDTHLWHDNIYSFTYLGADGIERRVREGLKDAAEGDALMISNWAERVKSDHHIYHLGDICMNRVNQGAERFIKLMKSLPGVKRWVPGNHDHLRLQHYVDAGFSRVDGGRVVDGMLLTHYPVHPNSIGHRVKYNIHGHTHQHPDEGPQYLNVSVERTNYAPVPIELCKQILEKKALPPVAEADVRGNAMVVGLL